jgi:hypothetical protein
MYICTQSDTHSCRSAETGAGTSSARLRARAWTMDDACSAGGHAWVSGRDAHKRGPCGVRVGGVVACLERQLDKKEGGQEDRDPRGQAVCDNVRHGRGKAERVDHQRRHRQRHVLPSHTPRGAEHTRPWRCGRPDAWRYQTERAKATEVLGVPAEQLLHSASALGGGRGAPTRTHQQDHVRPGGGELANGALDQVQHKVDELQDSHPSHVRRPSPSATAVPAHSSGAQGTHQETRQRRAEAAAQVAVRRRVHVQRRTMCTWWVRAHTTPRRRRGRGRGRGRGRRRRRRRRRHDSRVHRRDLEEGVQVYFCLGCVCGGGGRGWALQWWGNPQPNTPLMRSK